MLPAFTSTISNQIVKLTVLTPLISPLRLKRATFVTVGWYTYVVYLDPNGDLINL
jgi:hypothetical protein